MSKKVFHQMLKAEVERLDKAKVSKRHEVVIESFSDHPSPRAVIAGRQYLIFNSNDYLGLRHHIDLKKADHQAVEKYGTGPGAVRFISGSLKIYRELEESIARFHGREDAMLFSSAFATNIAVLPCLIKGQVKDSLVSSNTLVVSDELNHRSIIEGIRAASISPEQKAIFAHMNPKDLRRVLKEKSGQFDRVVVVTDGIFSMLGEYQDLSAFSKVISEFDQVYPEGVILVVDDAHGVGCFGSTGRGVEEVTGVEADVLVGTLGKAFGADGGYVVGNQIVIDYLRESAATYIYSNSISPGTAGSALVAFNMMMSKDGEEILQKLQSNIDYFKQNMIRAGLQFATDSSHPIQPLLIGDPAVSKAVTLGMRKAGFLVTSINYPVVPKGRDEIRIQISASHTKQDLDEFMTALKKVMSDQ